MNEKTPFYERAPQTDSELEQQKKEQHAPFWKPIVAIGVILFALWSLYTNSKEMTRVKGPVAFDSRRQNIDTGAQSLNGEFDLLDLLSIHSTAGSIKVGIHPRPADTDNPAPAELSIRSQSGQVDIDFPTFNAPERDYRVSIDSKSGSVHGNMLHGQYTSIATTSGTVQMQLTPYVAEKYASTMRISTGSSSQDVTLLSPSNQLGAPISNMSSTHSTNSGSLKLAYPREWEGTIEGHSTSGSLQLRGNGIKIIQQHSVNNVGHYVLAKKGDGNSTLNFRTGSGSVDIWFE